VTGKTQQFTARGSYTDGSTQVLNSVTLEFEQCDGGDGQQCRPCQGSCGRKHNNWSKLGQHRRFGHVDRSARDYLPGDNDASAGGTHPEVSVVADFDGDGKLDIAVSYFDLNTVAVFLNDSSGNFGTPIITTVAITKGLGSLSVGDFNEDGKADLVVATIAGAQQDCIVLLGKGDGTFVQQTLSRIPSDSSMPR